MIHDKDLLDRLSDLPQRRLETRVYRATGLSKDPVAASTGGGRWAPVSDGTFSVPVLYTSFERDGALAELSSFLASLTPIPRAKRLLKVSRLTVSVGCAVQLTSDDLAALSVDMTRYGERDYSRTQVIGAALAFLGIDGLIAPSARRRCDNLVIYADNHAITERLDVEEAEEMDWITWAEAQGIIPS
ncbi:RES family NAD+ phosphorylase [Bradyrhizobium paxllaeri]|uniref:RES family NAD+ phosphorylase n=1 Tax=Bradyrhizobium paxllaeri TaxID=190148 RepID=UPI0008107E97|nr:RES family NAD+ phosphorylase [Bradyrhizobium paxllaeri]